MEELTTISGAARALGITPMRMHRWIKATPSIQVYKLNNTTHLVVLDEVKQALVQAGKLPGGENNAA